MRRLILALTLGLLLLPLGSGWAERRAFVDASTGVLKAHGFVDRNEPGDLAVPVADDFTLGPGRWRWTGTGWEAFTPPPPAPSALKERIREALQDPTTPARIRAILLEWERELR